MVAMVFYSPMGIHFAFQCYSLEIIIQKQSNFEPICTAFNWPVAQKGHLGLGRKINQWD